MSWGIEVTGSKEAVKAKVTELLDKSAETYKGNPEGNDVLAAKARILALIDACAFGIDQYGTNWNAVGVKASGSHSVTNTPSDGIAHGSFTLSVTRMSLAL